LNQNLELVKNLSVKDLSSTPSSYESGTMVPYTAWVLHM